jgi:tRNA (guanine10-N2)-dimethyltransferase
MSLQSNGILLPKRDTLLFELSGEHDTLPRAEVMAVLDSLGYSTDIFEDDPGALVVDVKKANIKLLKERLALSHNIDLYIASFNTDEIADVLKPIEIEEGSFAVRAKRVQRFHEEIDLKDLERKVADGILGDNEVNLNSPVNEVRVIVSNRAHIGVLKARIPRNTFEERKVQNRPYFSPISLHPRLARALVNLSRVSRGQTLLDPFCGTGGILMEASLVGARSMGSDIGSEMVEGCKENLAKFKMVDVEVFRSDVGKIGEIVSGVDAIATDPPYGKSATTNREAIKSLYERAYQAFADVLKKGGYLSIVLPDSELIEMGKAYFNLRECHPHRVHRSLTRNFCVFKKV